MTRRIAMWSGPRNISTAMMRAWDARGDCLVCDEPLYAYYLKTTGLPHPGADEIIAHHDSDWRSVARWMTGPVEQPIFYQKHMAHHLLPEVEPDWINELTNCFLIREPSEMLTSLVRVIPEPRAVDTGLPQQVALYELLGASCAIIDSRDVLEDPAGMLRALCAHVEVEYTDRMLSWRPGPRDTDGVWARHWYDAVEHSTGFAPYRRKHEEVPVELTDVLAECETLYAKLHAQRLESS